MPDFTKNSLFYMIPLFGKKKSSKICPRDQKSEVTTVRCFSGPPTGATDPNKMSEFMKSFHLVLKLNRKVSDQVGMQNNVATLRVYGGQKVNHKISI